MKWNVIGFLTANFLHAKPSSALEERICEKIKNIQVLSCQMWNTGRKGQCNIHVLI